nr:MAG TPA: hypothetical protein [Caudoviricetes sp.]
MPRYLIDPYKNKLITLNALNNKGAFFFLYILLLYTNTI